MRRITLLAFVMMLALVPATVSAESLIGTNTECGTYEWHHDMTKGRANGMVVKVDHTHGCYRYVLTNLIGTGHGESYGYPGQQAACERAGRESAVGHFRWYRGINISGDEVSVTCSRYQGSD